ncbi:alpha/beta hydrolase-fold protein [Pelagicoccus sp. SDUM812002]|uniref:alpha/beta hydrolase n=1 Tax=Pelagicoccus sp. SDUM812002 TaxID=3041266 RepID=UPI00280CA37D|nr:alpha/beta hydrolase-fold protein [Pelagicoccus sp. SDUM812002]MDQ8188029.1 alpha/beta hydrolase-fold protein [Pelagicoccus sp. SDUM812002]
MGTVERKLTLRSEILNNERTLWIREPKNTHGKLDLLVVLDAELYRNRVQVPDILESLFESGDLDKLLVVYVSCVDMDTRWIECPCYPPFSEFVFKELLPRIHEEYPDTKSSQERVIAGLSYTGLAASFAALSNDGLFTKVISQSGSYWSNDCWLIKQFDGRVLQHPPAFFLNVGDKETQGYVWHKEDVIQKISQVEGVERFRDMLVNNGYTVRFETFSGGHSAEAWATSLPNALKWAFPQR